MAQADVDVVLKSIANPACITLKKTLNPGGVEAVDPPEDILTGDNFMQRLPNKKRKQEVWECIMGLFDNLSAAHSYMSLAVANMSSLAKIADEETFNTVLKASIHLMVQLNIPEKYLKLTKDLKPKLLWPPDWRSYRRCYFQIQTVHALLENQGEMPQDS